MLKDTKNRRAAILGLLLVGITLLCCAVTVLGWTNGLFRSLNQLRSNQVVESEVRETATPGDTLIINHETGSVTIRPDGVAEVWIEVTARARSMPEAQAVELSLERDEGMLQVEQTGTEPEGVLVDLVIHTPPEMTLQVTGNTTSVRVEGLTGPVEIQTSTGDVTIRDHTAKDDFRISVETGRIDTTLSGMDPDTSIDLSVATGNVTLAIPDDVGFEAEASTDTGTLKLDDIAFDSQTLDQRGTSESVTATVEPIEGRAIGIEVGVGEVTIRRR